MEVSCGELDLKKTRCTLSHYEIEVGGSVEASIELDHQYDPNPDPDLTLTLLGGLCGAL